VKMNGCCVNDWNVVGGLGAEVVRELANFQVFCCHTR
jgi:hypothetical protein